MRDDVIVPSCEDLKTGTKTYLKYDNLEVEFMVKMIGRFFDTGSESRRSLRFAIWNVKRRYAKRRRKSRSFVWLRHHHRIETLKKTFTGLG